MELQNRRKASGRRLTDPSWWPKDPVDQYQQRVVLVLIVVVLIGGTTLPAKSAISDVLQKELLWSGKMKITGVEVIPRGVTLVILPGTQLEFEFVDEDGDGKGDSGIDVQGNIRAIGTNKEPITFHPPIDKGASGSWRGIKIDDSGWARFSNCSFKGAQWAIHNHFTPLIVEKSRFLLNDGGVKFRGNPVKLRGNYFMNNGTAVRYWESDPDIRQNTFSGNDTAIFCREGSSESTVRGNNFLRSTGYHIKLGELQSEDVDAVDNYWGAASNEGVEEKIYDRMDTPYLGRVNFIPFREAPVSVPPAPDSDDPTLMIDHDVSNGGR